MMQMGESLTLTTGAWALRLGVAVFCGAILGLNRDLHHKPAGFRTFSLVSLASTTITLLFVELGRGDPTAVSRVVQGIVTGIGFLGAGLILHRGARKVSGLTTAAAVWLAAVLGVACGLGFLTLALVVVFATLAILTIGRPLERWLTRRFGEPDKSAAGDAPDETPSDRDSP
jgi:putative Mg2+ transporter-C (MgtC) family protein